MKINIAIDGPAASGKSAAADLLAKKIKYCCVDTGIIYRSFTYYCLKNNLDLTNMELILSALPLFKIDWTNNHFLFNDQPPFEEIYNTDVANKVPIIAENVTIREFFNEKIRRIVNEKGFIVVGRDITSVVLPDAELKIFLTSSLAARSSRRYLQYLNEGLSLKKEEILKEMQKRDEADKSRSVGQLIIVPEALILDNSDYNLESTVELLFEIFQQYKHKGKK